MTIMVGLDLMICAVCPICALSHVLFPCHASCSVLLLSKFIFVCLR